MFTIPQEYAAQMVKQALEEAPNEACGLIAGKNGVPVKLYPTTNSEASPTRYLIEPREQLDIMLEMEQNGWDLLAIYHSHIGHPPTPSHRDIKMAYYHDAVYLIVSVRDKEMPELKAFHIAEGKVAEEELRIAGPAPD